MSLGIILLFLFIVLLLFRVNIAFSCGIVTLLYLLLGESGIPPQEMIVNAYQALDRFPMLAVPLFIMAGAFMGTGGVAKYLLRLADEILGGLPGGLAMVTVPSCLFFGGLSGSAPATVAAIGSIMIPAMIKQGYKPAFAAGICAASGVLAIIIPPSNPMIIYALANNASVGKLFLGGFIPGFLLALGIIIPAYFVCKKNGWTGEKKERSLKSILKAAWEAKWALLVPIIILGGIYSGMFTPTESAAVACFYAMIVGLFVYKEFTWKDIPEIMKATALPIVAVFVIVCFAAGLGIVMTMERVPQTVAEAILGISNNKLIIFLVINLLLLFIGTFMDTAAAIIILSPLLYPVVKTFGMNEIHFGIMLTVNLGIGFVTPPFGSNLFVANQMTGLKIQSVFRSAAPLLLGMIVALALITYVPNITMILPDLFYK